MSTHTHQVRGVRQCNKWEDVILTADQNERSTLQFSTKKARDHYSHM